MVAVPVITEIGIFLLISNGTPYMLLHFCIPLNIWGILCIICSITESNRFSVKNYNCSDWNSFQIILFERIQQLICTWFFNEEIILENIVSFRDISNLIFSWLLLQKCSKIVNYKIYWLSFGKIETTQKVLEEKRSTVVQLNGSKSILHSP